MTLRKLLTMAVWLMALLVLVGAASLMWSTTLLHRQNGAMLQEFETARLSSTLQLSLFQYRYYDGLWTSSGQEEHFNHRQEAVRDLWAAFQQLSNNTGDSVPEQRIEALRLETDAFFRQLELAHGRFDPDGVRVYEAVDGQFRKLQAGLEQLVDDSAASAKASQVQSGQLDRRTDIGGGLLGIFAVVLSAFVGRLLWRQLYIPVLQLKDSIARYARGDRASRCDVSHPREFAEIGATFNELAERLEEQRAAQLRFLAAVAHDLRNPLSSMKLYAHMFKPDRPLPEPARIHRAFQAVGRQVDRLERMTTDLLDATRIEAGELAIHLEPVDLRKIAREVITLLEDGAPAHQLRLEGVQELELLGDSTRLYQVLMNLVSNAIKYSPQGGVITVNLSREADEALVAVSDEGVGVMPGEAERIFEPFRRSGGLKDNIPGVGLGLSVTRRIVQAHGGEIEVHSEPGHGSTFVVRLPAAKAVAGPFRLETAVSEQKQSIQP